MISDVRAFGAEIRRRRVGLNMSLETLAETCGLSTTYLGEVETSTRRPRGLSLAVAFKIAKGLGVELSELLGFRHLTGAGLEAGRIVSTLPPRTRSALLALLRALTITRA
jgi:transcriptional regulator with XRE-family HTH domain